MLRLICILDEKRKNILITKMNMQRKEADAGYLPSKENFIRTMKINEVIS